MKLFELYADGYVDKDENEQLQFYLRPEEELTKTLNDNWIEHLNREVSNVFVNTILKNDQQSDPPRDNMPMIDIRVEIDKNGNVVIDYSTRDPINSSMDLFDEGQLEFVKVLFEKYGDDIARISYSFLDTLDRLVGKAREQRKETKEKSNT